MPDVDDPYEASSMYYLVGPGQVAGFGTVTEAARFKEDHGDEWREAELIRHSRRSLRKLSMKLLMGIVRLGRPDKNETNMKRPELTEEAFKCLWAASNPAKQNPPVIPEAEPSPPQEQDVATTIGRFTNVREMRTERKRTKAAKGSKVAKPAKAAKGSKAATTTPRATDEYAGKKLYLTSEDKSNPRREGTLGWKSLEIIRQSPGILYETYCEKGGRRIDLKGSLDAKPAQVELK